MFTPIRRIAPAIWVFEKTPGYPCLVMALDELESSERIKAIVKHTYPACEFGELTARNGLVYGPLDQAVMVSPKPAPKGPFPGLQPATTAPIPPIPIEANQSPSIPKKPYKAPKITRVKGPRICKRPAGHEGPCGAFRKEDTKNQVDENGKLVTYCMKPLEPKRKKPAKS